MEDMATIVKSLQEMSESFVRTFKKIKKGLENMWKNIKRLIPPGFTIDDFKTLYKYLYYTKYNKKKRVRNKYKNKIKKLLGPLAFIYINKI